MQKKIKVVDSPCGFGKSSYAIQYINSLDSDTKIIYITPFIKETERIKKECPSKNFSLPSARKGRGSKMNNLYDLIASGKNIASTHSLFGNITDEVINLLRSQSYILILDEVMNVVERLDIYDNDKLNDAQKDIMSKEDINTLIEKGILKIDDETKLVSWDSDTNGLYKYTKIKNLADRNLLYYLDGDLLIWTFPIEVFRDNLFDEIFILTYQFKYQIQAYYYDYFGLDYDMYMVIDSGNRNYKLIPENPQLELDWRKSIKDIVNVCDNDKLNKIGNSYVDSVGTSRNTTLSKTWFDTATPEVFGVLKKNIANYYSNITKSKSKQRMWTSFKAHKKDFKDAYIPAKSWIELNCRASNEYADKSILVYPINRYLNPFYFRFFDLKGIKLDQDMYALSELIQWMFRSAIRNGEPIQIYIPSERMRTLFLRWLDGEF